MAAGCNDKMPSPAGGPVVGPDVGRGRGDNGPAPKELPKPLVAIDEPKDLPANYNGTDFSKVDPDELLTVARAAAKKNNVILGLFLFGTARVGEFLDKGFPLISLGNDLHHILTQATAYVKDVEAVSKEKGKPWGRRPTALM